jgi:predicted  nucleic acid-binding Zn-ribbon protein
VWLSGPAANDPQSAALKQALELRSQLVKVQEQIVGLEREQAELANSADETRRNLRAIEKVKSAQDLRARLVDRLRQLDTRLGELTKLLVDARTRQSELEVRLNESLDDVSLEAQKK